MKWYEDVCEDYGVTPEEAKKLHQFRKARNVLTHEEGEMMSLSLLRWVGEFLRKYE